MKAGFYETDITPQIGMKGLGSYQMDIFHSIHDPLKVRAAVFGEGDERVALVGVDTCTLQSNAMAAKMREAAHARTGIQKDRILIAASHAHAAGPCWGFLPEELDDAPASLRNLILEKPTYAGAANPPYCSLVIEQTTAAIHEADRRRQEAAISIGSGYEDKATFNRRFHMKNGRVFTHPGKGNPDIIGPAGPIDPEVGVVGVWDKEGKLLGCIVNFACHGTTFGAEAISADWIYYLEQTIRGALGADAIVVFLNGACGDVTQVDNLDLREAEFGERWSRHVGTRVGAEALKVLVSATAGDVSPIAVYSKRISIARRRPSAAHLEQAHAVVERGEGSVELIFATEILVADYLYQKQPTRDIEVQAIQLGPAVFVANSSEFFCELGLTIKRNSPFPFTYVVELANGIIGYVPDEAAFEPSGGGYETALTGYSNLDIAAGRMIADASLDCIRHLTPGELPLAPQDTSRREPWGYGVLGPDVE